MEKQMANRWFRHRTEPFLWSTGVQECARGTAAGCHNDQSRMPASRHLSSFRGTVYAIYKDQCRITDVKQAE